MPRRERLPSRRTPSTPPGRGERTVPHGPPSRFARMLRFLTAGESHGRALVVIVEGMPAGLLVTAEDIQRGLARRRLGFGRGPRMRFEADEVIPGGRGPARTDAGVSRGRGDRQHRVAQVGDRDVPRPRPALQGPDPAPAGSRRPRRHAEVRARRCPGRARAGLGPRDGGPGGGGDPGQAPLGPDRGGRPQPRGAAGAGAGRTGSPAHRGGAAARRPVPGPVRRPRRRDPDGGGHQGGGQGRRLARGRRRGHRLRRAGRAREPRALGSPARRADGPGAHEHPGHQGGGVRRRRRARRPPRLGGPRCHPGGPGRRARDARGGPVAPGWGLCPRHRSCRRDRGGHLHRLAHRGPRRR